MKTIIYIYIYIYILSLLFNLVCPCCINDMFSNRFVLEKDYILIVMYKNLSSVHYIEKQQCKYSA